MKLYLLASLIRPDDVFHDADVCVIQWIIAEIWLLYGQKCFSPFRPAIATVDLQLVSLQKRIEIQCI